MKLRLQKKNGDRGEEVEGKEARALLKDILHLVTQDMLLPEPPYTGIVRRQAIERLKDGGYIAAERDHNGQPQGMILTLVEDPKIIGTIKDGKLVLAEGVELPEGLIKEIEDVQKKGG